MQSEQIGRGITAAIETVERPCPWRQFVIPQQQFITPLASHTYFAGRRTGYERLCDRWSHDRSSRTGVETEDGSERFGYVD